MTIGFTPSASVAVDENTGGIRAAYLRVREGEVADTREISEGCAFADYDGEGVLLGVSFWHPATSKSSISWLYPNRKRFGDFSRADRRES